MLQRFIIKLSDCGTLAISFLKKLAVIKPDSTITLTSDRQLRCNQELLRKNVAVYFSKLCRLVVHGMWGPSYSFSQYSWSETAALTFIITEIRAILEADIDADARCCLVHSVHQASDKCFNTLDT